MGKWHPLHTAAISGDIVAVQKEFNRHSNKSSKGKGGKQRGNVLNDLQDSNGYTALHFAIQCGNLEPIQWMIENGADVNIQSKQIADGVTPLLIATNKGHEAAAKLLLESGANPRICRSDGYTPLHLCAKTNHIRIGRLILEHVPSTLSVLTTAGLSCIDVAKAAGSTQFITTVLGMFPDHRGASSKTGAGAGAGAAGRVAGGTPGFDSRLCRTLIEVTRRGDPGRLKGFIKQHPSVDLNWTMGKNGWSALMEVSATGDVLSAQVLLEGGADSEIRSKKGATALLIAARYGHKEVLSVLLEKGACLDAVTPTGETVEEVASKFGQSAVFAFFVAYRADLIVRKHRQADRQAEQQNEQRQGERKEGERDNSVKSARGWEENFVTPPGSVEALISGNSNSNSNGNSDSNSNSDSDFNLVSWLTSVGLGKYADTLHSNGFDSIQSLVMITAEDFQEMRFLLGHKRLFLAEVAELRETHPLLFSPKPKSFTFTPTPTPTPSRSVSSEDLARSGGGGGRTSLLRSASSTPDLTQAQAQAPLSLPLSPLGGVYAVADVLKADKDGNGDDDNDNDGTRGGGHSSPSRSSSMSDISSEFTSTDVTGAGAGGAPPTFQERYNDSINSCSGSSNNNAHHAALNQMTMIKEIRYEEISIGRVIGEGSFGIVRVGVWRGMSVAVKALKITEGFSSFVSPEEQEQEEQGEEEEQVSMSVSSTDDESFLRHEAQLMARVCNHDNVIQFVGIVVRPCPCVVTIFCSGGSVDDLLVRRSPSSSSSSLGEVGQGEVLRMALEAARGIRHLHLEGVIHRDLAARNLLLDGRLHVRVGDFGFSRVKAAAASKGYTKSDMGPVRWQAPEAMRRKVYSEASDVFSFGVVLFEMFWGRVPWAEFDTLDVAIRVCSGERMQVQVPGQHEGGGEGGEEGELLARLLGVMQACWSHVAVTRPTLNDVIASLEGLQLARRKEEEEGGHVEVDWEHHEVRAEGERQSGGPSNGSSTTSDRNMYSMKLGNDAVVGQQP